MRDASFDLNAFLQSVVNDVFLYYGKFFAALAAQLGLNLDPVTALFFGLFAIFLLGWFVRRYIAFALNVMAVLVLIEIVRRLRIG